MPFPSWLNFAFSIKICITTAIRARLETSAFQYGLTQFERLCKHAVIMNMLYSFLAELSNGASMIAIVLLNRAQFAVVIRALLHAGMHSHAPAALGCITFNSRVIDAKQADGSDGPFNVRGPLLADLCVDQLMSVGQSKRCTTQQTSRAFTGRLRDLSDCWLLE